MHSVAPLVHGDSKILLKVSNHSSPDRWVWGGISLFFPHSKGLSKARSVISSIFGEILCDENTILVPIVHTENEHISIISVFDDFFSDTSITYKVLDSIDIPTHMDLSDFRWMGSSTSPYWRLGFAWACEKSLWPLTTRKIEDFKKLSDILGVKSKFEIQSPKDFYGLLQKLSEPQLKSLISTHPAMGEVFDIIVSNEPISISQWDDYGAKLGSWLKLFFPWMVDDASLLPPRSVEKTLRVFLDAEKVLKLFLVQHPYPQIKTHEVLDFFKDHGLLLSMDQITQCLKNFVHTTATSEKIDLQYKIKAKARVWVMSRTTKDNISVELSLNPFYV